MIAFEGNSIVAPKLLVNIINVVGQCNRAYCVNIRKKMNSKMPINVQRDICPFQSLCLATQFVDLLVTF